MILFFLSNKHLHNKSTQIKSSLILFMFLLINLVLYNLNPLRGSLILYLILNKTPKIISKNLFFLSLFPITIWGFFANFLKLSM